MPLKPQEAYDRFETHVAAFCVTDDNDIEGQHFDRKEVPRTSAAGTVGKRALDEFREEVKGCVSGFANSNATGGLLVIGISKAGEIRGIKHLREDQKNSLTDLRRLLLGHSAQVRFIDCTDLNGQPNQLILVYVPHSRDALCETLEDHPRSWKRVGSQTILLTHQDIETLRRDKGIVSFERRPCAPFDPSELDLHLIEEVRQTWSELSGTTLSDTELLHQLGALDKVAGKLTFTNAGLLFFCTNPQRVLSTARIRLLRFESEYLDANRGLPTLEKEFTGSITKQLRDFRVFLRESGLFRVFQFRKPDGGFAEEPELPPIAIDEVVVNAAAHRDYACAWPIECEYYRDAFIVRNAGRLLQRDIQVPPHFQLDTQQLVSLPRNPRLMQWLKSMKDAHGAAFVRALAEGTRRMNEEMRGLDLPAPRYDVTASETMVTLLSEAVRRKAREEPAVQRGTEFANLYPLQFRKDSGRTAHGVDRDKKLGVLLLLRDRLKAGGWFIDRLSHGVLTAHRRGVSTSEGVRTESIVKLFPSYSFTIREYHDRAYLTIDYGVEVKNVLYAHELLQLVQSGELVGRSCVARVGAEWERGRIRAMNQEYVTIQPFDVEGEVRVPTSQVVPDLSTKVISRILTQRSVEFDLHTAIKRASLATQTAAARIRADRTQATAEYLSREIFPIRLSDQEVVLSASAVELTRGRATATTLLVQSLTEPTVEFRRHQETSDIRDGITRFGSYDHDAKDIEVIPLVQRSLQSGMASLIERLKLGKYKYQGSERTFGTRLSYGSIIPVDDSTQVEGTCARLLSEHKDWVGDPRLQRIFLVHTPEQGFSLDDEASPYYKTKRLLLEAGVPCQMVDSPTLLNPDWKDLNLALNIVAKCGVTPWVLPEGIPDADFFVGLSYTQHRTDHTSRLMGYANVFSKYGKWLFYSGNTQVFPYEERRERLGELVSATLNRLPLSETPHIHFHYSARFSFEDREAILVAARAVRPEGTYSFVWIIAHHPVRLYDRRPETDGSLQRGSFVVCGPNQILLSTTGYNTFRKLLGTPNMLELNVWRSYPANQLGGAIDLRSLAVQILALTKLNWSSTDSLTGEPITTKYAGDIAYLTASFLRQKETFTLHPVLEQTPWFL